jgi:glycerol-3-phosphate acyltransferase PlsX
MFNFENFGGTPILGVNAPLIIGHGISTDRAIENMLAHTYEVIESGMVNRIKEELEK